MELQRRAQEDPKQLRALRRGWCLGGAQFREELLAAMHERTGAHHGGEERREADEAWARRRLTEDIKREGWTAKDLAQRRKGDPGKVRMARASAGGNDNDAGLDRQRVEYGRGGFAGEPFAKKEMTKICDYAGPLYVPCLGIQSAASPTNQRWKDGAIYRRWIKRASLVIE
ncbi:MAG TPA: hypothetical protein VME24_12380 [Alphaproteobacteria bacterium]|nr:hypothetical protein [Alphaproteobacteria bacterium]